jgi:hypothetical protein
LLGRNQKYSPQPHKKIGKITLKSSQNSITHRFESNSWKEILPTSPPTSGLGPKSEKQALARSGHKNSSETNSTNFSKGSTSKWWEDIRAAQKNSQKVDDCLDDIDREFEELEKMIDECDIGSSDLL